MERASRVRRGLAVALFVALIGPLVGTLAFLGIPLARMLVAAAGNGLPGLEAGSLATMALFLLIYGYVFGGVPAIVAGAALGWLTARRGNFGYGHALLIGALGGAVGGLVLGALVVSQQGVVPGMAVFLTPFAAAAAVICRWLMGIFRIVPRDGNISLAKH